MKFADQRHQIDVAPNREGNIGVPTFRIFGLIPDIHVYIQRQVVLVDHLGLKLIVAGTIADGRTRGSEIIEYKWGRNIPGIINRIYEFEYRRKTCTGDSLVRGIGRVLEKE